MRISWLKILLFLFSLCLLAGSFYGAWWYYQNYKAETTALRQQTQPTNNLPKPDPGIAVYNTAITLLDKGETIAGRTQLLEIMRHYQDSQRFPDAKRILGELNTDTILSDEPGPGKTPYIVKLGDSINAIVTRTKTTLEYIIRTNGLYTTTLQPGEKLLTAQLDFQAVANISAQTLTLLKNDKFFKEYTFSAARLPPSTRIPFETSLKARSALDPDKNSTSPLKKDYATSEKWLIYSRSGILLRTQTELIKETDTGIFLSAEDMDELFLLLPLGTTLTFVQ